jgi:hypothetical protein
LQNICKQSYSKVFSSLNIHSKKGLQRFIKSLPNWNWGPSHQREFKMKLNLDKCTFGVPSRKLLGYMVSHHGIDPNLDKVMATTKMKLPRALMMSSSWRRCMAALSRFISWLGVRGLPFFKLLKKQDKFQWTQEAQEAFEDLKKYLTTTPTLVALEPHKNL